MKKINLNEIKTDHLKNSCFVSLDTIDSNFLLNTPLFISSDLHLYGTSLSVFKSLKEKNIDECYCIFVSKNYNELYDIYLHNISSNVVLSYDVIREKYPNLSDVENCSFDFNQKDLLYCNQLDEVDTDIKMVEEEKVKIKKEFKLTIVLNSVEENYRIQKFFRTNTNEISFSKFYGEINNIETSIGDLLEIEVDDEFYRKNFYHYFIINSSDVSELNQVLDFFKINADKKKTLRVNFKTIEKNLIK